MPLLQLLLLLTVLLLLLLQLLAQLLQQLPGGAQFTPQRLCIPLKPLHSSLRLQGAKGWE
jgi:hypothetical protein